MKTFLPGAGRNTNVYLSKSDSVEVEVCADGAYSPDADFGTVSILVEGYLAVVLNDPQTLVVHRGSILLSAKMASEIQSALFATAQKFAELDARLAAHGIS